MGLLTALVRGGPVMAANAFDERYWSPTLGPSYTTDSGIRVSPDLAFQVSCIFQGTRLIAAPMGRFKPIIYRRLGEDGDAGKERARDHPLWPRLMRAANGWMTASRLRVVMTAQAVLWGNAYAEIRPTPDAAVGELLPLDPDRVTPEQLPSTRIRYRVQEDTGIERILVQEQVFHLPGFGIHKFMGAQLLYYARQAVGLWIAQEQFNSMYFRQGARPSLWMKVPGKLGHEAYERLRGQVSERLEGVRNMHRVLIGEEGAEFKEFGFTARESQMTEARESQVHEIARWMNIPVHLLRAVMQPTYASIEMFNREYYDITLADWFDTWEQEIGRQLLADPTGEHFVEFLLDSLLRASTVERFQAYGVAVDHGIMTRNEVRAKENLNPLAGGEQLLRQLNTTPDMDMPASKEQVEALGGLIRAGYDPAESLEAVGMAPITHTGIPPVTVQPEERQQSPGVADGPPQPPPANPKRPSQPQKPKPADENDDEADAAIPRRLVLLARQRAMDVVGKETARLRQQAVKLAGTPEAWSAWLSEFYQGHAAFLAEKLQLEPLAASDYCDAHRAELETDGIAVCDRWDRDAPAALLTLVLEGAPA